MILHSAPGKLTNYDAVDGKDKLIESNIVSEYLDRKYVDSGPQLFPTDPLKLAKVTELC